MTFNHHNQNHQQQQHHYHHQQQQQQQQPNHQQHHLPQPPSFKIGRHVSNSNPTLDRTSSSDVHVEYEVSVPIVPSFRHTPYHSLWNLHEWYFFFGYIKPFFGSKIDIKRNILAEYKKLIFFEQYFHENFLSYYFNLVLYGALAISVCPRVRFVQLFSCRTKGIKKIIDIKVEIPCGCTCIVW